MKRLKAMAAIMAAATILSTGVVPVCAADNSAEVAAVQAMLESDAAYQSEVFSVTADAAVGYREFRWGNLDSGYLDAKAYKTDLESVSMANDSLASGSTFLYDENSESYVLTIQTQSVPHLGYTASPTSATATYYLAGTSGGEVTVDCAVADNTITVAIPEDAYGFTKSDGSIPGGYANMIKVSMKTTLADTIIGTIAPSMASPTFYYAFDVAATNPSNSAE